jgi:hypothetical protein
MAHNNRYRGPLTTVGHAVEASVIVTVTCQRCSSYRQMYAFKLGSGRPRVAELPLYKAVPGFFCKRCRHKVHAVIRPVGYDGPTPEITRS